MDPRGLERLLRCKIPRDLLRGSGGRERAWEAEENDLLPGNPSGDRHLGWGVANLDLDVGDAHAHGENRALGALGGWFGRHDVRTIPPVLCVDTCLLYTSDAADEEDSVDLGGRRIIKKKKKKKTNNSNN
eukprot:TRINITY_DN7869_c0_g1_i6.p1 TRINITY_DN7869_c0_g1~~TRINITY_DN7869_c0_g1_i6.p1  ORF type:complete len:130 (-),score=27.12 TRINITY_DN7869_c0_g1_i6:24-413(-)